MSSTHPTRRSYGTGSLYTRTDANGRETWYGRWYADDDGARVKRRLGRPWPPRLRASATT